MIFSRKRLTDPEEIIREFQKRQKRVVVATFVCFAVMIPLAIEARNLNTTLAIVVLSGFALVIVAVYFWNFRCPACGARVQQRRSMLRIPMRCLRCEAMLDAQPFVPR